MSPPISNEPLLPSPIVQLAQNEQECFELRSTNNRQLRIRHRLAKKAATDATLGSEVHMSAANDEWQSDDGLIDTTTPLDNRFLPSERGNDRTRRRSSTQRFDSPFSPPSKRIVRASANNSKRVSSKEDQKWIALLERNNEDLMSQIQTLTSDAHEAERTLRNQLHAAQMEISSLKDHLRDRDKAFKALREKYDDRQCRYHSSQTCGRSSIEKTADTTDLSNEVKRISQERDVLRIRAKIRDGELIKSKRRNAQLAEEILNKRGLEMTVEGQNRYLHELSAALEETRRVSASEPALSPRNYQFPSFADSPVVSPFCQESDFMTRRRPESFDGTQWQEMAHARHHSLMDLAELRARTPPSQSNQLPTPPLTNNEESPQFGGPEESHDYCGSFSRAGQTCRNRGSVSRNAARRVTSRPTLKRNESSLWAEIYQDVYTQPPHQDTLMENHTEMEHVATDTSIQNAAAAAGAVVNSIAGTRDGLLMYMVHLRSVAATRGLCLLLYSWAWVSFIAFLTMAFVRIVREGPDNLTTESRSRLAHDITNE